MASETGFHADIRRTPSGCSLRRGVRRAGPHTAAGRQPGKHRRAALRRQRSASLGGHGTVALSGARHRRVEMAGRDRLAGGAGRRDRVCLHQGDRGRRPGGRPLHRELLRGAGGRGAARGLSLLLLLPDGGGAGALVHRACAARCGRPARMRSTWNGRTSRGPAGTGRILRMCAPRWRCSSRSSSGITGGGR